MLSHRLANFPLPATELRRDAGREIQEAVVYGTSLYYNLGLPQDPLCRPEPRHAVDHVRAAKLWITKEFVNSNKKLAAARAPLSSGSVPKLPAHTIKVDRPRHHEAGYLAVFFVHEVTQLVAQCGTEEAHFHLQSPGSVL
jgi:hypothetical protein